jgi:hypothetical protein
MPVALRTASVWVLLLLPGWCVMIWLVCVVDAGVVQGACCCAVL